MQLWQAGEFDSHATTKINNMSKAMKMTPFLIKLLKEKQIKTNRKK